MCEDYPLVSIIIPVYNGSNYVAEAIDSALNQTYDKIEIIIVNDGSDDNGKTEKIIERYGRRVRYYKKDNGGVSSALNLGIKVMRGEFFSWLSHDDLYSPEKIKMQVDAIQRFGSDLKVCLCKTQHVDEQSNLIGMKGKKRFNDDGIINWEKALREMFRHGTYFGCALLIHKDVFCECGNFDESLRYCQDSLMWMKIFLHNYRMAYVDQIGVFARIHDNQVTKTSSYLYKKDVHIISKQILNELKIISNKNDNFYYEYARKMAVRGQKKEVVLLLENDEEGKFISLKNKLVLLLLLDYSKIRPGIKRMYRYIKKKRLE